MVDPAMAGEARTAVALAELCPLPLPPLAGGGAPSACAQLVQALCWAAEVVRALGDAIPS